MTEEQLENLRLDLKGEVKDGKLNFNEVGLTDLLAWYEHEKAKSPEGLYLQMWDILSLMRLFEEWVKR